MSPRWFEGPVAGLDFETTGVDPLTARPVSVALAVLEADGATRFAYHELVDCGVEIPAEAAAVHGHTTESIAVDGVPAATVMAELVWQLREIEAREIPLVIFNARFDWPLLHVECARHGLEAPRGMYLVDPALLDRGLDKWRRGKRTLSDCAGVYGIRFTTQAHEALADVVVSIHLARALARRYERLADASLLGMQGWQADLFRAWREGINAHWERNGKSDRVDGEWPWGPLGLSPSHTELREVALR